MEGHEVHIGGSIGISETIQPTASSRKCCCRMPTPAMYQAKTAGRGACLAFTAEMTEATRRRQKVQNDLRYALKRGEFSLHYQPLVCTATGVITGVEALLRWQHPELGSIPPGQFIPQLEELGLMAEVGRWVLKHRLPAKCRMAKSGHSSGAYGRQSLRATVSAAETWSAPWKAFCMRRASRRGWLDLELTES